MQTFRQRSSTAGLVDSTGSRTRSRTTIAPSIIPASPPAERSSNGRKRRPASSRTTVWFRGSEAAPHRVAADGDVRLACGTADVTDDIRQTVERDGVERQAGPDDGRDRDAGRIERASADTVQMGSSEKVRRSALRLQLPSGIAVAQHPETSS